MEFHPTAIPDVVIIEPKRHGDARGLFAETFRQDRFDAVVGRTVFVQDNHSISAAAGTIRGLHFQRPPAAQGKLVRCTKGRILDVAVDIRAGSPTFGRHVAVELSADNWRQLWLPAGFAHGFCTLEADCEVVYKTTDYYSAADDAGLAFDDPDLAIDWPVAAADAVLSEKDRRQPAFADLGLVFDVVPAPETL
ncbi:dTDP-4-dehydrorhamnose 3,5-epimerase [Methylobrevis pamukkalensis]|uniref:dTDP-4-dehydrorhamnose 3,5-epimerase n=1 Tax=Methylobrevis pamukkalensis TaxID=1439726 RepID=A0A1E3H0W1_9HYPH|nr:dTDP-4-dehydrorhamnose 3,5-epimerase [Methylobrevis pamukkalensis]ODN69456.1 dTDP-4-dehydrorhamnose 3,5-epimerase [Methylobrevis pamukkalensis]